MASPRRVVGSTEVWQLWFRWDHDHGGPVGLERFLELACKLVSRGDISRPTPETGCQRGNIESRQIQRRHIWSLPQKCEGLKDRFRPVAQHHEDDGKLVLSGVQIDWMEYWNEP